MISKNSNATSAQCVLANIAEQKKELLLINKNEIHYGIEMNMFPLNKKNSQNNIHMRNRIMNKMHN